jgi:phosphate transport system protein
MLDGCFLALENRDVALADATIARDDVVDDLRFAIERKAMELIATQQPAARDLRRSLPASR